MVALSTLYCHIKQNSYESITQFPKQSRMYYVVQSYIVEIHTHFVQMTKYIEIQLYE